jgi:cell shape-determining protein MreC
MVLMTRRSRRAAGHHGSWQRVLFAALPFVALGLLLMPQGATDRLRLWVSPVFSPLQNRTEVAALDIADRMRRAGPTSPQAEAAATRQDVATLENALAEATGLLNEKEQIIRDLGRLRADLDGLPCRLTPARLLAPEIAGGQAAARLSKGSGKGVRKGGAVIVRRIDRGARDAIERGEPVLVAAGLVGVVDEVGPVTSTVRLTTDPRTNLMVQIITRRDGQWRAGPEGLARGSKDGTAVVVQEGIPPTADVAPGDFVVTSASPESALPPYLIVGRVVRCDLKPAALFYSLVVEPRVALEDLRDVYVLSPEVPSHPPRPPARR